jgi:NinB protein
MTQSFYLPIENRDAALLRIERHLLSLPRTSPFVVMVTEKKPNRTLAQNALMWSLYDDILRMGGEMLGGWTAEELHRFCLGEHYGWQKVTAMGMSRMRPLRTSSRMSKTEFSDHIEWIARYMAEKGIVVSLPGDVS